MDPDLGMLCLFAVRYALGRRSAAPSDVCEVVRRRWSQIDAPHRALIGAAVWERFELAGRSGDPDMLGDECDRREWAALGMWIWREVRGG